MKRLLLLLGILAVSFTAHADEPLRCTVLQDGELYPTDIHPSNSEVFFHSSLWTKPGCEKHLDLLSFSELSFNLFGMQFFQQIGNSVIGGKGGVTKLDFEHKENKNMRGVLFVNKTPGKAAQSGQFKAVFILTGVNLSATVGGAPLFNANSLVLNIECEAKNETNWFQWLAKRFSK